MPLPSPHQGETREDFLGRCMADETMIDEFGNGAQRLAVCTSQWDDARKPNPLAAALRSNAEIGRDPTRTVTLRREYVRAARKRFREVDRLIRITVGENDALRIDRTRGLGILQQLPPGFKRPPSVGPVREFEFTTAEQRVEAFMDWLGQAVDAEILEVIERDGRRVASRNAWQNTYVRSAYNRGLAQAESRLRRAGVAFDLSAGITAGIGVTLRAPRHADALGILFTRNFEELRGITSFMSQQIARTLTAGLARGWGHIAIADAIRGQVSGIGINRAVLLARTEIINAHAEATLNRYQDFGIDEVEGMAEFATAGDNRVCSICANLEGQHFTIAEARGLIPVHPNCRCSWLPVIRQMPIVPAGGARPMRMAA